MKKLLPFLLLCCLGASAQTHTFRPIDNYLGGDPTGVGCSPEGAIVYSPTTGSLYTCHDPGTGLVWTHGQGPGGSNLQVQFNNSGALDGLNITTDATKNNLFVPGTVTATTFSGAGTALSGTASGLTAGHANNLPTDFATQSAASPQAGTFTSVSAPNLPILVLPVAGDLAVPINNAIAACPSTGCRIEVAPLTTTGSLSAPILITKNKVALVCDSTTPMATSYSSTPLSSYGNYFEGPVEIDNADGVTVQGCTFDVSSISLGLDAIHLWGATNTSIRNNRITSTQAQSVSGMLGIRAEGTLSNPSSHDTITGNFVHVPYISYSVGDNAQYIDFGDNHSDTSYQCFDLNGSGGNTFNISSFSITGGVATLTSTVSRYNRYVGQAVLVGGLTTGTYLNGDTTITAVISPTQIQIATGHADVGTTTDSGTVVLQYPDAFGIKFHDGICVGDQAPSYVESARDVSIQNNHFWNDSTAAKGATIRVHATNPEHVNLNTLISGNVFVGTTAQSWAAAFFQNAIEWQFIGNTVKGYGQSGIRVAPGGYGVIASNLFINNGQSAIASDQNGILLDSSSASAAATGHVQITGNFYYDDQPTPTQLFRLGTLGTASIANVEDIGDSGSSGTGNITDNIGVTCTSCTILPSQPGVVGTGKMVLAAAIAGTGAGLTTGPTTSTTNHVTTFADTAGTVKDSGLGITGAGAALPTGPTTSTAGHMVTFADANGTLQDGGAVSGSAPELTGYCTGTATSSTTIYFLGLGDNTSTCTGTASSKQQSKLMVHSGTATNLYVDCGTAGVNASSGVFTVLKATGAGTLTATALTCTVGTGTTCNDTTHTFSYIAGDRVAVQFTTQATETLGSCTVGFQQ